MTDANVRDAARALLAHLDSHGNCFSTCELKVVSRHPLVTALRAALAAPRDEKPAPKPDVGRCWRCHGRGDVVVGYGPDGRAATMLCPQCVEEPAAAPAPAKVDALYEVFLNYGYGEKGEHFTTTHDAVYAGVLRDSPHYIVVEYVPRTAVQAAIDDAVEQGARACDALAVKNDDGTNGIIQFDQRHLRRAAERAAERCAAAVRATRGAR